MFGNLVRTHNEIVSKFKSAYQIDAAQIGKTRVVCIEEIDELENGLRTIKGETKIKKFPSTAFCLWFLSNRVDLFFFLQKKLGVL